MDAKTVVIALLLLGLIVAARLVVEDAPSRPRGRSTQITSAPMSASRRVALGPAQKIVKSSTRTPASGRSPPSGKAGPASPPAAKG